MNECALCHAEIPDNRSLCEGCDNDIKAEQARAGDAERVWRERAAKVMGVD